MEEGAAELDIRAEIQTRVDEIEQIIKRYLPEEEGYQKTIMEAMNYSILAGGKRLRRHLPGGGTAAKGAGAGNGPSFHRRKLNFVQICTASLSQPFYQGKSAYPDLHFLPVHLSDHGGVGKRDCGYRAYRGK